MTATFKVSPEIGSATTLLSSTTVAVSLRELVAREVEASGANATNLVTVSMNPFLDAIHTAFALHYPLALSPDDVWLAIAQGFANHVNAHAETLRSRFVAHEGKVTIQIRRDEFEPGSANNDWPKVFDEFAHQIGRHIGRHNVDLLVSRFSTTTPIERAASQVVLMEAMRQYFAYETLSLCGIPEITLLGSVDDWKDIRARARALGEYDCVEWSDALEQVLNEFVAAAQGVPRQDFWQSLYKRKRTSGGPFVTGWVNTFFPYLCERGGPALRRNGHAVDLREHAHGPNIKRFPIGVACVPFVWRFPSASLEAELLAGFVAISQDPESYAVRPAIGWAVSVPRGGIPEPQIDTGTGEQRS